jgi:hypothetical protein
MTVTQVAAPIVYSSLTDYGPGSPSEPQARDLSRMRRTVSSFQAGAAR